ISRRYYGTIGKVSLICEYNHIEDQDSIFYGQTIVLP
ncbi:MAG: LysM peptidoglycan-binding domain-containing protein, partial [Lachnospiraceae bacterium]|nr:LysM peptidoglycan-binding domain-containing protein [Lachnospiraceae bacterium]